MNILRLLSSIYKELLVLVRDKAGLALLFLMPTVLILIMTILQDSTYKTVKEARITMLFVNNDNDSLGLSIRKGLESADIFDIVDEIDGEKITEEVAEDAIANGDYKIGIIIPAFATQAIRNNVNLLMNQSFDLPTLPGQKKLRKQTIDVKVIIDPVTSNSFINSTMSSLKEFTAKLEIQLFFKTFSQTLAKMFPDRKAIDFGNFETISFNQVFASGNSHKAIIPNSVQHNVPAWTMFAMFFIVLPLAGNMISERKEGSAVRLKTMPGSYLYVLAGKVGVYLMVSLLQFALMLALGKFVMPLIGLPELTIGTKTTALFLVALASGLAATGFGVAIGTIATSHEQSSTFGAVAIIIFAALGGIWVPVYIMPSVMRIISQFSPLHWGLNAFYDIFLRSAGLKAVYPDMLKLIAFFILCVSIAFTYNKVKRAK